MMDNHVRLKSQAFSTILELNTLAMDAVANNGFSRSVKNKYFKALFKITIIAQEAFDILNKNGIYSNEKISIDFNFFNDVKSTHTCKTVFFGEFFPITETHLGNTQTFEEKYNPHKDLELTDALNTIFYIIEEFNKVTGFCDFSIYCDLTTTEITFNPNGEEYRFSIN